MGLETMREAARPIPTLWGEFRTRDECLGIEMDPLIPPLERAKNIFAFSPFVSGYEAKDTVKCS
jgi:hypothetical protein